MCVCRKVIVMNIKPLSYKKNISVQTVNSEKCHFDICHFEICHDISNLCTPISHNIKTTDR